MPDLQGMSGCPNLSSELTKLLLKFIATDIIRCVQIVLLVVFLIVLLPAPFKRTGKRAQKDAQV